MLLLPVWANWLILCGILFLIEIFTVSFLFLWPGIGAFLAFVCAALGLGLNIQIAVFATSSILLIIFTKPLTKKLFTSRDVNMNNKSVIGKNGIVLKAINNTQSVGQVKVSGEIWSATSASDDIIETNSDIIVESIDGVKLVVRKSV